MIFDGASNAVTPIPNWPSFTDDVPRSVSPPLDEYTSGALDFNHWKLIGEEFLIKSKINDLISCTPENGNLVRWTSGSIDCKNVKNISSAYNWQGTAPDELLTSNHEGPKLKEEPLLLF